MSFNNCSVETNHFSVASQCHMVFFQNIFLARLRSLKWSFLRRLVRQDGLKSELFGNASQVSVKGKSAFKEQTFFKLYWKKKIKKRKFWFLAAISVRRSLQGLLMNANQVSPTDQQNGHFKIDWMQATFAYYAAHQRNLARDGEFVKLTFRSILFLQSKVFYLPATPREKKSPI